MYVCMYVCVCVCVYVCMYVYMYVYVSLYHIAMATTFSEQVTLVMVNAMWSHTL